jgi:PadR family transcriptional regulator AphA
MDIEIAILGYLSWKPFSGYDLKKIISESELFYWSGNNNQIYNSLIRLHKEGLVTQQVQYQENLPAKKIYTITGQGLEKLRQWTLANPELPEFRNNFLIQLAWVDSLSSGELDDLLGRYEAEMDIQVRMRKVQAGSQVGVPNRTEREKFLWGRIAENLVAVYQQELDWVRQLRTDLK